MGRICFSKVTCIFLNQTHEWGFISRLATTQRVGDTRSRLRCSLGQMFTPAQPNTFLGLFNSNIKVQQTNYTQIGQTSKVKVSNSRAFSIRGLWMSSHLSLTRQAIGFTQLSTRMYSVFHHWKRSGFLKSFYSTQETQSESRKDWDFRKCSGFLLLASSLPCASAN